MSEIEKKERRTETDESKMFLSVRFSGFICVIVIGVYNMVFNRRYAIIIYDGKVGGIVSCLLRSFLSPFRTACERLPLSNES